MQFALVDMQCLNAKTARDAADNPIAAIANKIYAQCALIARNARYNVVLGQADVL